MSYQSKQTNAAIRKLLEDNARDYADSCEATRQAYMKKLPYGDPIPAPGKFYDGAAREEYRARCLERQRKAREIIEAEEQTLKRQTMEAPTDDAASVLTLMSLRSDITPDEFHNFMDQYGSNYQARKTARSLAKDRKIYLPDDPLDTQLENLGRLKQTMQNSLTLDAAESGHTTEGYISFVQLDIDSAFATE